MSLYWFATNMHWGAILIITLPQQSFILGGDVVKGRTLGLVLGAGAFVSMLTAPLFGAISDRIITRFGRRRPWVAIGTLMNILGIFGLIAFAQPNGFKSLPLYILAFMWVEFWNNVATGPYSALIPDIVPIEQRGSASGWMGLMTMLGTLVGGATGLIFTNNGVTNINSIYYFVAAIMLLGMLGTVLFTREPAVVRKLPPFQIGAFVRGLLDPFKDHDFRWVFWTRFLMVMGQYTVQEFLQYYMGDVVKDFRVFGVTIAQNAESAVSFFLMALLVGAVISSLAGGIFSDKIGRKKMVYISSVLQAFVPLVLIFYSNLTLTLGLGIIFGLGYGAYTSVDWAMASDVLPSEEDYAKDMGVWHVAMTLPQVVSTPIAGVLRDNFQLVGKAHGAPALGYQVIFALAAVYFILGTLLVRRIRKVN